MTESAEMGVMFSMMARFIGRLRKPPVSIGRGS